MGDFLEEDEDIDAYLRRMAKLGEYGDDLMLESACRAYSFRVEVLKKTESGDLVWMKAGQDEAAEKILLYLEAEHYENLVTLDDVYR